jgi:hypothetical protein
MIWNVRRHELTAKAIVETLMNAGVIDEQYLAQMIIHKK